MSKQLGPGTFDISIHTVPKDSDAELEGREDVSYISIYTVPKDSD